MKNARAKRAFFIVKYANLWGFCCHCRRGCLSSLVVLFNESEVISLVSQSCSDTNWVSNKLTRVEFPLSVEKMIEPLKQRVNS